MSQITNTVNSSLYTNLGKANVNKVSKLTKSLEQVIQDRRNLETSEAKLKTELKELLKPAYFKHNENAEDTAEVEHVFDVDNLQVNFANSYIIKDVEHADKIKELLGSDHPLTAYIQQSQKIVVDVSSLTPDTANELAFNITKQAIDYGIKPEVERKTVVGPDFHSIRHVLLSKEDNQSLDKVLPVSVQLALIK